MLFQQGHRELFWRFCRSFSCAIRRVFTGSFRNPLADPGLIEFLLSSFRCYIYNRLSNHFVPEFLAGPFLLPIAAIAGAMLVIMLLLLTKGFKSKGTTYMLLIGIAINFSLSLYWFFNLH